MPRWASAGYADLSTSLRKSNGVRNYRRLRLPGESYFFTVVTHDRRPLFANQLAIAAFKSAQAHVASRHPFDIEAEVILPDHIHSIWSLPEGDADYSTRWMLIKATTSRRLAREVGLPSVSESRKRRREVGVWQRRFWEHAIRDEKDFVRHVDYIHFNPVKHGLVSNPEDWPYSTYRLFHDEGHYEHDWPSRYAMVPDAGIGGE